MTALPDLSPELFEGLDPDFCCGICLNVVTDPQGLPCPHLFCNKCLKDWMKESVHSACPTCRIPIRRDQLKTLHFVSNKIAGSRLKCPNSPVCAQVLVFGIDGRNLLKHLAECKKVGVRCPDCKVAVEAEELEAHRRAACEQRFLPCPHCARRMRQIELPAHCGTRPGSAIATAPGEPTPPCKGLVVCPNRCTVPAPAASSPAVAAGAAASGLTRSPSVSVESKHPLVGGLGGEAGHAYGHGHGLASDSLLAAPSLSFKFVDVDGVKQHLLVCPRQPVPCPICAHSVPRGELHAHIGGDAAATGAHMLALMDRVAQLQDEVARIKTGGGQGQGGTAAAAAASAAAGGGSLAPAASASSPAHGQATGLGSAGALPAATRQSSSGASGLSLTGLVPSSLSRAPSQGSNSGAPESKTPSAAASAPAAAESKAKSARGSVVLGTVPALKAGTSGSSGGGSTAQSTSASARSPSSSFSSQAPASAQSQSQWQSRSFGAGAGSGAGRRSVDKDSSYQAYASQQPPPQRFRPPRPQLAFVQPEPEPSYALRTGGSGGASRSSSFDVADAGHRPGDESAAVIPPGAGGAAPASAPASAASAAESEIKVHLFFNGVGHEARVPASSSVAELLRPLASRAGCAVSFLSARMDSRPLQLRASLRDSGVRDGSEIIVRSSY